MSTNLSRRHALGLGCSLAAGSWTLVSVAARGPSASTSSPISAVALWDSHRAIPCAAGSPAVEKTLRAQTGMGSILRLVRVHVKPGRRGCYRAVTCYLAGLAGRVGGMMGPIRRCRP